MNSLIKAPFVVFGFSLLVMWLAARIGLFFRTRQNVLEEGTYEDFDLVVGAILTLLGLIVGFSFSMAITRYDQRMKPLKSRRFSCPLTPLPSKFTTATGVFAPSEIAIS